MIRIHDDFSGVDRPCWDCRTPISAPDATWVDHREKDPDGTLYTIPVAVCSPCASSRKTRLWFEPSPK